MGKTMKQTTWPWRVTSLEYHHRRLEGDHHNRTGVTAVLVVFLKTVYHLTLQGEGGGRLPNVTESGDSPSEES